MSRVFGEIRQPGRVVHRIEVATEHGSRSLAIGSWRDARGRFCCFDTEGHPGKAVERSEVAAPKGRMFDMIREASRECDGRDPVRPLPAPRTL